MEAVKHELTLEELAKLGERVERTRRRLIRKVVTASYLAPNGLKEQACRKALKEIAVSMGISEAAVKSLLHRARDAFKVTFLKLSKSFNGPFVGIGGLYE